MSSYTLYERANSSSFQQILDWISEHPYQTAFQIVNGIIIFTPAAVTTPVLHLLGFRSLGPLAGSIATSFQSYFGFVPARGAFATSQSAAMAGYGYNVLGSIARAGAAMGFAAGWVFGWGNCITQG